MARLLYIPLMQIATLLVFKPEVSQERINAWIEALKEKGVLETSQAREFDAEKDMPVLYFP